MTSTTCRYCGASVVWTQAASGARYLANVTARYDNGSQFLRGPHAATCDRGAARQALVDADRSLAQANARRAGVRRWISVFGITMDEANIVRAHAYVDGR